MNEYLKKIKKVIVEKSGADADEITETSYFQDDLNISEMELVEILSELEEEYHVNLIDEKDSIETVQDLIDLLVEQLE
jgi:acyl carrier protein